MTSEQFICTRYCAGDFVVYIAVHDHQGDVLYLKTLAQHGTKPEAERRAIAEAQKRKLPLEAIE